jgi:hypothetical protein
MTDRKLKNNVDPNLTVSEVNTLFEKKMFFKHISLLTKSQSISSDFNIYFNILLINNIFSTFAFKELHHFNNSN